MNGIRWPDIAGAAAVAVTVTVATVQKGADPGTREIDALAVGCLLAGALSLMAWRRSGVAVVAVVTVTTTVYLARGHPEGPVFLTGLLALLGLGYTAPRPVGWIWAGVTAAMTGAGEFIGTGSLDLHDGLLLGWVAAAVLAGQAIAAGVERAAVARERVAHREQQALAAERLRIAQDLHDSLAHAMATINVQSGVAAHLMTRQPDQVGKALEVIRAASRSALDELGVILGVLRDDDGTAPRAPVAGLARVTDLAERARADGLRVSMSLTGQLDAVPAPVGTAAYRVVQEALTNSRRHAGTGATATVSVDVTRTGRLEVAVHDDGGTSPAVTNTGGAGLGLTGMRERVTSTGGQLVAEPVSPRGFRVIATWPERE